MIMFEIDKNAFAAPVSARDHSELISKIAEAVVKRRMATPAVLLIESCKPLNRLASQFVLVISPLLALFLTYDQIDAVSDLLQDRKSVEQLRAEIEKRNNI